jgi:hypothetical protein
MTTIDHATMSRTLEAAFEAGANAARAAVVSKSKPIALEFLREASAASCAAIERAVYEKLYGLAAPPRKRGYEGPRGMQMAETMAQLQAEGRVRIDWTRKGHPWVLA